MAGMTIHIALESTIHIAGISTKLMGNFLLVMSHSEWHSTS
jgi:hypothetical protein